MRLLGWLPPSVTEYVYTVLLRPAPLRAAAQRVVKWFIPESLAIEGIELVLNPEDAVVSGALALGCYERLELKVFRSLLRPGMCVVDVGANIGLFSAVAAAAVGPAGRVMAVEPDVDNCAFLRRTLERNGLKNVDVQQLALSDADGEGQLFLCPDNKADHRIFEAGARTPRRGVPIRLAALDTLLARECFPRVDILKMDVQGAEARVFAGMARVLRDNPDLVLLIEFWPWGLTRAGSDPARLLAQLRAAGFSIEDLDGDRGLAVPVVDDDVLLARKLERHHNNLLLRRG